MLAWESACRLMDCSPQWPTVEQPQPRWGRSAAIVRRTWGQYSSPSPSPTHLPHTTTSTFSRIKCERLYFYKEVCLFVHWSSSLLLTMFLHIFVYVYVQLYVSWIYNIYDLVPWPRSETRVWSFYSFEILQRIGEGPIVFGRMKDASVLYFDARMSR